MSMPRFASVARAAGFAVLLLAFAATTLAQDAKPFKPGKRVAPTAAPAQPAQPASQAKPAESAAIPLPPVGPYLKQDKQRDWIFKAIVRLDSDRPDATTITDGKKTAKMPSGATFRFTEMHVVWPVVPASASAEASLAKSTGRLFFDDRLVDEDVERMTALYHGGIKLIRLDFPDPSADARDTLEAKEVTFEVSVPVTTHNVIFDEKSAMSVPWPKGPYPTEIATTLEPQMFVDFPSPLAPVRDAGVADPFDRAVVQQFIAQALTAQGVKDPKDLAPVMLAKVLTRAVWDRVQPTGAGVVYRPRTGELQGFDLQGPAATITTGRGSAFDSVALLATCMRRCGLPVRLMIGYDASSKSDTFLAPDRKGATVRAWVEFALFDERGNTYNWIPVDVERLRKMTSRPMQIDRTWKFFGTHDEFEHMVPFACHFHPPTDVISYGAPAVWGWNVAPVAPPEALQAIRFDVTTASKRASDQADSPADPNAGKSKKKGYGK